MSNGHEFQGVGQLREILGTEPRDFPARYLLLRDDEDDIETVRSRAKWYDARAKQQSRSAEWRLYYPNDAGAVQARMAAGDLMVVCISPGWELLVLLAAAGSSRERQLQLLFGISDDGLERMRVRALDEPVPMDFLTATILEQLGLAPKHRKSETVVAGLIEELSEEYPENLPPGQAIAHLVRERLPGIRPLEDPDGALYTWMEAEAVIYRGWEDRKIERRLQLGFTNATGVADIQSFRSFSMSLRQSRVSRAGGALQYHFRAILDIRKIRYVMAPVVDGGEIPDFVFPSKQAYDDAAFPADRLRMIGAKYTAKDRWRQVLNEARRIERKHLLTLEASISKGQLHLMSEARLTLVIPQAVRGRYPADQQPQILSVREFLDETARLDT